MKRLLITLLILGGASLNASQRPVQYYDSFSQKLSTMAKRSPEQSFWLKNAQAGRRDLMEKELNKVPQEQQLLLVNAYDKNGETAVMHAVSNGHPETVSWLIDRGADLTKTNYVSINAFEAVASIIKEYKKAYKRCHLGINDKKFHTEVIKKAWKH